ncbi:MAG TPA: hypothetical protein VJ743_08330 [Albitalea sp.]|nr:hypothetical protein [Albitalea sp.]
MTCARRRHSWRRAAAVTLTLLAALAQAGGEDESFMPKGGRTLLIESLGAHPKIEEFRQIASARRDEAQWVAFIGARAVPADERGKATLAAYLAVNMPLPADKLQAARAADLAGVLPRDGRDLAWNQCPFCHSLFTSHLTQNRDLNGWRAIFLSPFHREMKMTAQEREEFARYSAINMPMKVDDVPSELRF